MNIASMLTSKRYQSSIYLNDRPYYVLDIGEGDCTIILVDNVKEWMKVTTYESSECRYIIVDISKTLAASALQDRTQISKILTDDLHLLLDVFLLEQVQVKSVVEDVDITFIEKLVAFREESISLARQYSHNL